MNNLFLIPLGKLNKKEKYRGEIETYPFTFLEVGYHDDDMHILLPDHSPESLEGVLQRTLKNRK